MSVYSFSSTLQSRSDQVNYIAFPCEYERPILAGIPGSPSEDMVKGSPALRDLLKSDDNFLSLLEAIHYISFPGW
jgi:hypothetical protein